MLSSNSPILRAPSIQKLMTLSNVSPPLEDTPLTMNPPPLLPRTEIYVTWSSMFHILTISMLCRGFSRYPIFLLSWHPWWGEHSNHLLLHGLFGTQLVSMGVSQWPNFLLTRICFCGWDVFHRPITTTRRVPSSSSFNTNLSTSTSPLWRARWIG